MDAISLLMDILSINNQNSQSRSGSGTNSLPLDDKSSLSPLVQYLLANQERMARIETEIKYFSGSNERLARLESDIEHIQKELNEEKEKIDKRFKDIVENKRHNITTWVSILALLVSLFNAIIIFNEHKSGTPTPITPAQSLPDTKR